MYKIIQRLSVLPLLACALVEAYWMCVVQALGSSQILIGKRCLKVILNGVLLLTSPFLHFLNRPSVTCSRSSQSRVYDSLDIQKYPLVRLYMFILFPNDYLRFSENAVISFKPYISLYLRSLFSIRETASSGSISQTSSCPNVFLLLYIHQNVNVTAIVGCISQ